MARSSGNRGALPKGHGLVGLLLVVSGEAMVLLRDRPWTDFYFPVVWLGYVLLLDNAIEQYTGWSLWRDNRRLFASMLPLSAAFWWLFELLNAFVHNWHYVGTAMYTGAGYVAFATLCFAFVLLAVWLSAMMFHLLLPGVPDRGTLRAVPGWVLAAMLAAALLTLVLPVLLPRYAFGLIWMSMFFLLDPINERLGRPSIIGQVWSGHWRLPLCFALGALLCGFFWESWNFWAMPKWEYTIPYVGFWHVFEMPLLGWTGYLPFGLELFAMTNFVLPLLGFEPLTLSVPVGSSTASDSRGPASAPAGPLRQKTAR